MAAKNKLTQTMSFKKTNVILRLFATLLLIALVWGVIQNVSARHLELMPHGGRLPPSLLAVLMLTATISLAGLTQIWFDRHLRPLRLLRNRLGWIRWVIVCIVALAPCWFYLYTHWNTNFQGTFIRLMIYLTALALAAWLAADQQASFSWKGLYAAIVVYGSIFALANAFRNTTSYPFSLYWSEGNRLWDYSVLFGRRLYDYPANQPINAFIDLGRQSLWGLPFLIPGISIWWVRFWSAFVFSVPYILLGWAILPLRKQYRFGWLLFGLWSLLFLNQGPIYTPLVLSAILVALTRRTPLWLGFILMVITGYATRMSRFTWLFAPSIWAAMLALVEAPPLTAHSLREFIVALGKNFWQTLWRTSQQKLTASTGWQRAIVLAIGGVVGGYGIVDLLPQIRAALAGASSGPSAVSVEGITNVVNRQPLLWDRLLPNNTYPPGILLGLLMATAPLITLLFLFAIRQRWQLDIWQKLALLSSSAAFLVVGIIISVKIGGGSNLHNLDMFLITLLFAAALAWEAGAFNWLLHPEKQPWWLRLLLLIALAIPASQGMMKASPLTLPAQSRIDEVLGDTRLAVAQAKDTGEVLFIDQRQLLTFGFVKDVPLVPEYEKKLLMDQAMADNRAYFEPFYKDLAAHRFSLIISEPLWINFQADQYHFGNENNAWVNYVSIPVLCYYQPTATYMDVGLQLLVPKPKSPPAAGLSCP
ncbi:MAG: hypothetical protein HPY45_09200 [Anaerolineae bacterium]|nr:hypothetical protein [Anaerolineae bacterium]